MHVAFCLLTSFPGSPLSTTKRPKTWDLGINVLFKKTLYYQNYSLFLKYYSKLEQKQTEQSQKNGSIITVTVSWKKVIVAQQHISESLKPYSKL